MGYLNEINNPFEIITGDGVKYSSQPGYYGLKILQQSINFDINYQLGEFNFINTPGRLVTQTVNTGRIFNAEFYFDGPLHKNFAENFRKSCDDKRPWQITHPQYGLMLVKTAALNFDNSSISFTKITGTLLETMGDLPQSGGLLPLDQIPLLRDVYVEDAVLALTKTPTPSDITSLQNDNKMAFQNALPIITLPKDFEDINNAYAAAVNYINYATSLPILMMRSVISVLLLPSQFQAAVNDRMRVLLSTFNTLRKTLFGVVTVSSKQLYQNKQKVYAFQPLF